MTIEEPDKNYHTFNYIYVLDYSDATICEIIMTENKRNLELEDIIEKHGCNINTSSWMCTDNKIDNILNI